MSKLNEFASKGIEAIGKRQTIPRFWNGSTGRATEVKEQMLSGYCRQTISWGCAGASLGLCSRKSGVGSAKKIDIEESYLALAIASACNASNPHINLQAFVQEATEAQHLTPAGDVIG